MSADIIPFRPRPKPIRRPRVVSTAHTRVAIATTTTPDGWLILQLGAIPREPEKEHA